MLVEQRLAVLRAEAAVRTTSALLAARKGAVDHRVVGQGRVHARHAAVALRDVDDALRLGIARGGAVAAALRARVWDSAPCKAWLLGHPYLITTALVVGFTAAGEYTAMWWSLAALVTLAAAWVVVAARRFQVFSQTICNHVSDE